jgi:hypothetical protein
MDILPLLLFDNKFPSTTIRFVRRDISQWESVQGAEWALTPFHVTRQKCKALGIFGAHSHPEWTKHVASGHVEHIKILRRSPGRDVDYFCVDIEYGPGFAPEDLKSWLSGTKDYSYGLRESLINLGGQWMDVEGYIGVNKLLRLD